MIQLLRCSRKGETRSGGWYWKSKGDTKKNKVTAFSMNYLLILISLFISVCRSSLAFCFVFETNPPIQPIAQENVTPHLFALLPPMMYQTTLLRLRRKSRGRSLQRSTLHLLHRSRFLLSREYKIHELHSQSSYNLQCKERRSYHCRLRLHRLMQNPRGC